MSRLSNSIRLCLISLAISVSACSQSGTAQASDQAAEQPAKPGPEVLPDDSMPWTVADKTFPHDQSRPGELVKKAALGQSTREENRELAEIWVTFEAKALKAGYTPFQARGGFIKAMGRYWREEKGATFKALSAAWLDGLRQVTPADGASSKQ